MNKNTTEIEPLNDTILPRQEPQNLPNLPSNFQSNKQGAYEQINELFNERDQQEKSVQEGRDILGDSAKDLTDSEVYDLVNEVQYLVDTWLDEYERKTFDGKTLNELLSLNP